MKFSVGTLFIKLTSRQLWVWLITTYIVYTLLLIDGEHAWFLPLIIVWGVVSVLYIGGNVLVDALGKMIEKANLAITQNNTVSTNISGTIKGIEAGGGK
jgi:hypothetical protein